MKQKSIWTVICLSFIGLFMACTDEPKVENLSPVKIKLTAAEQAIMSDQKDFATNLFASLYKDDNGQSDNLLISPFSVYCALGMLANGAEGETKAELLQALGQDKYDADELDVFARKMVQGLNTADPAVIFKTANSIWSDKHVVLKDEFIRLNQEQYDAQTFLIDFSAPSAVSQINDWCKEHTEGKIPEIIKNIPGDAIAYLLNAVYFKARWEKVFPENQTVNAPFYLENGQTVEVPFMNNKIISLYNKNELFSTLALSYSTGTYYMNLIVPEENVSLQQVVETISQPGYLSDHLKWNPSEVEISIPRFEIEADYELINALRLLGIQTAFNRATAEFGALTEQDFFVSRVKHSTCLKVDEEGSEGAAVTLIGGATAPMYEKAVFKADRPFLFLISENETGAILFIGKVGKP